MSTRTYLRLALSVALGAVIGAAVIAAPEAHADSIDFLRDIHALGWYNRNTGDVGLLNQGYGVCRAIDGGATGSQVADVIYRNTGWDVTENDAANFVILAVENLCPQFDHRTPAMTA